MKNDSVDTAGQSLLRNLQELSPLIQVLAICLPVLLYALTYIWKLQKYSYLGIPHELVGLGMKDVAFAFSLSLFVYGVFIFDWINDFRHKQRRYGLFWSLISTACMVGAIVDILVFTPIAGTVMRYGLSEFLTTGLASALTALILILVTLFRYVGKATKGTEPGRKMKSRSMCFIFFAYALIVLCAGVSNSTLSEIGFFESEETVAVAFLDSGDAVIKEAMYISPDKKHVVLSEPITIIPAAELPKIAICSSAYVEVRKQKANET